MLVWAGILVEEVLSVTGNLGLRYRRAVDVDDSIVVSARVDERNGRRLRLSGELVVGEEVMVEASGLYLVTIPVAEMLAGHRDPVSSPDRPV
jgi:acyl-CoA thioesterase FadM